jgi:hypothetical protein
MEMKVKTTVAVAILICLLFHQLTEGWRGVSDRNGLIFFLTIHQIMTCM